MRKNSRRNIEGLLQYATSKKNETEEKVNRAIDSLKGSKTQKINFKTVSVLSGVSTTTLYNNPVLCERIRSLRAIEKHPVQEDLPDISVREEIRSLKQEIQKLKEEKKMLVTQLLKMEQVIKENEHLRAMLGQVKRE
jgi:hypothetical protein